MHTNAFAAFLLHLVFAVLFVSAENATHNTMCGMVWSMANSWYLEADATDRCKVLESTNIDTGLWGQAAISYNMTEETCTCTFYARPASCEENKLEFEKVRGKDHMNVTFGNVGFRNQSAKWYKCVTNDTSPMEDNPWVRVTNFTVPGNPPEESMAREGKMHLLLGAGLIGLWVVGFTNIA
ncbi:hypothetical protein P280DRAFT_509204 [Massarina eburnea CBS 473.64]|uniref:Uncharacterized protein n=1 Tax=Massarina eburnea CBS 473.64 TaxID=1395130 RepID=A0A6A6RU57_9PLEO|nr:hypothetical protein P280DRAFT_509204 [Massarina eburnea CBS 473.64]